MIEVNYEFQVGKYKILKLSSFPKTLFSSVIIDKKSYELVPVFDLPNSIAIESDDSFLGMEVLFV